MTNSGAFPPGTRELQLTANLGLVVKKQANCDPDDPTDERQGNWWDRSASDAEPGTSSPSFDVASHSF
jgi:hypothetical protein